MIQSKLFSYACINYYKFTRKEKSTMRLENNPKNSFSNNNGIAMVTVILFLVVMTVLGITMANTTIVENYISRNQHTSKSAFFDADAGIQHALAWIKNILNKEEISENELEGLILNNKISPLTDFNYSYTNITIVDSNYCFTSTGSNFYDHNAKSEIEACFFVVASLHPAFSVGLLSDKIININGASIIGDEHNPDKVVAHANETAVMKSGGNVIWGIVSQSAEGNPDIGGTYTDIIGGQPNHVVPQVKKWTNDDIYIDSGVKRWKKNDLEVVEYIGNQTLTDNFTDKVILVDGNVTLTGVLKNVTLISTGNITFQGSSDNDDGINRNALMALGTIEFNGSSKSYATFWCNGNFRFNGSSQLVGAVVSGGDIRCNGGANYKFDETISNDDLPQEYSVVLAKWIDKSL